MEIKNWGFRLILLFLLIMGSVLYRSSLNGQITYKTLYTTSSYNNYSPDINLPVGSVGGSADVAIGASSYLIPIELPAGTNGVIPNIGISYSSQAMAGYIGYGWMVNGLSSITRGLRTIYHDSLSGPVLLTSDDRFLLDGNRLVCTNGIYGSNGSQYAKELTDFSRVTSYGNVGVGPHWFKLETKDGVIIEYGKTSDSKFLTESSSDVLVWNINKMIWPDSNYIEFVYEQIGREHRIKEIKYTGNSLVGLQPYNKINFIYDSSQFSRKTYEAGSLVERNNLLYQITITTEDNLPFKSYTFSYAHDNVNEFLVEITEQGSDGSALNPTIFQYGDNPTSEISGGASGYNTTQATDVFTGDYDGDGLTDMAIINKEYVDGEVFYKTFTAFRNNPITNSFLLKQNKIISSIGSVASGGSRYNFFSADFTGDGADDIVYSFAIDLAINSNLEMADVKIFSFSNNMDILNEMVLERPSDTYKFMQSYNRFMTSADFNGDGISDIILILRNASNLYKAYIYYGGVSTGFAELTISGNAQYHPISVWDVKNINVLDFDGDGKSELMITRGSYSEIFRFDTAYQCKSIHAAGYPTEYHLMFFGDFNGDKKTDMLTRASLDATFASWSVSYSSGTQWHETPFTFAFSAPPQLDANYRGTIVYIADLNGDGKQDIFKGRTSTNSNYQIYYSIGSNFHLSHATWPYAENAFLASSGDFNGDGRSDMQFKTADNSPIQVINFNKLGKNLLLTKVKNGYGHTVGWDYTKTTDVTNTYMRTSLTAHPLNTVQAPMYLVHNMAIEGQLPTRYEYRNMRLHKGGRGMLGFGRVTKYSPSSNLYEETDYETTSDTYLHLPKTIRYKNGSTTIQLKTFTNEVTQLNIQNYTKLLYHRVPSVVDVNTLEGKTITNSHTVDNHGNVLTSTTDYNGVESIVQSTSYEAYGSFIPNKVLHQTTTKTRTGQSPYTQSIKYEYNNKGQTTGMHSFFGEPQSVYTQYFYNLLGNQDSTYISAVGVSPRTSASAYDAKGRFVVSARNTLGQTSTISEYDLRWAKPKTSTGIDGITTTYEYDGFGRQTSMTMAQGYTVSTIYEWVIGFPQRYAITTIHPGKPNVTINYDRANRPIETSTVGSNNTNIITKNTYDIRGRVSTKTAPHKVGDPEFVTTYTYDTYSRIILETNSHTTTQMSYAYANGLLTTTTTKVVPSTGNQIISTVTDATNKVISATDPGGTLSYIYHSNGEVAYVHMGGDTLVSNTYDIYGRKSSTTDISTGTTSYHYDAYGQLIKEVNPLGHTTVQSYNDLGQVTTRTGTEGTTLYEYYGVGTGASINKPYKVTSFLGDIEEVTYDNFGRVETQTTTVDGTTFTNSYTYNIYDQVSTESYTGGFGVRYIRDNSGYITSVQNENQTYTFFNSPTSNAYLQLTNYTLGSGFSVIRTYNQQYLTSVNVGNIYFNMSYVWDYASGNLTSRTLFGQTESFQYDVMNRLQQTSHPSSTVITNYMSNGNITAKTDAGPDYIYDPVKIYAMRGIDTPVYPNNINLTGQNIIYTPYQQPATITEGDYRLDYRYGHNYQRNRSILKNGSTEVERIYYMGPHERKIKNNTTYDIYYISSGDDLIAIAVKTNGGAPVYYYTYTDYLGSILEITNATGLTSITGSRQNYDAWGRRRNTSFQFNNLQTPPEWLVRGYTGHEMLWDFRLINMNGRIYDPVIGRVVSPDNVVSTPQSTQGYNRYSYVHNNPLRYTDPDGNIPVLAAVAIGAAVGVLGNGINNAMHHRNFFDGAGKAAAFGAIGGLVSAGIGSLAQLAPTALDAAVIQMNLHGLSAGFISFAQGGNPVSGFVSGATSSVVGSFSIHLGGGASATLLGGALSGGVGAAISGGDFWMGVQQGLITTGLNHLAHEMVFGMYGGGDPIIKNPSVLSKPIEFKQTEFDGAGLALFGLLREGVEQTLFNSEGWYDFRKGKTYSHKFHGNQHTGLRKSAISYSSKLNILGRWLGIFNQYQTFSNASALGVTRTFAETGVNVYSTFGGLYGAVFGVGWEVGRVITNTRWYQNWKYDTWLPYRAKTWGY